MPDFEARMGIVEDDRVVEIEFESSPRNGRRFHSLCNHPCDHIPALIFEFRLLESVCIDWMMALDVCMAGSNAAGTFPPFSALRQVVDDCS